MAGSLTISIANIQAASVGPSRHSEAIELDEMIRRAMAVLASSHASSITIKDRSGNVAGTISWTPANN